MVIDASFIGLTKLLPAAHALLRADGQVLALIKPQFEVGPDAIGKRGVVRDQAARQSAIVRAVDEAVALGFEALAQADCVLAGPQGNLEHFVWLRKPPSAASD